VNFLKGRNAVVPFKQRRRMPRTLDGALVELPDGIDHRMVVRVQNVLLEFRMARDMHLRNAICGTLLM
jgi:hypothetical protein